MLSSDCLLNWEDTSTDDPQESDDRPVVAGGTVELQSVVAGAGQTKGQQPDADAVVDLTEVRAWARNFVGSRKQQSRGDFQTQRVDVVVRMFDNLSAGEQSVVSTTGNTVDVSQFTRERSDAPAQSYAVGKVLERGENGSAELWEVLRDRLFGLLLDGKHVSVLNCCAPHVLRGTASIAQHASMFGAQHSGPTWIATEGSSRSKLQSSSFGQFANAVFAVLDEVSRDVDDDDDNGTTAPKASFILSAKLVEVTERNGADAKPTLVDLFSTFRAQDESGLASGDSFAEQDDGDILQGKPLFWTPIDETEYPEGFEPCPHDTSWCVAACSLDLCFPDWR